MSNLIILSFVLMFAFMHFAQNNTPDLSKPEDIKALGMGKIIQKDNSVFKNIKLLEIKEYWIVYEKNSSSHDMMMETIRCIEFPESKWGFVKVEFSNNKPELKQLFYEYVK